MEKPVFDIKKILKYGDKRDIPVIARMIALVICCLLIGVFYFNLVRFNWDASFSDSQVRKNVKAVKTHDYSDIKKVETRIKALEARETSASIGSAKSSVYYMKKFRNSVILGDSVTEGLTVYGYLSNDQVFCAIGASLLGSKPLFKKAAKIYPDNAFFSFGMNDLITYRGETKPFIKLYKKMLRSFVKKSPDTSIYINSISVPDKGARKRQKSLKHYKEYNKALEKLCDQEGYTYIDNSYILENNPSLYAGDGIHVQTTYYPIWMNDMITEADL